MSSFTLICGFTRGCFECEADATHEVEVGSYDDERSGLPSSFTSTQACPRHARAFAKHTGRKPPRLAR